MAPFWQLIAPHPVAQIEQVLPEQPNGQVHVNGLSASFTEIHVAPFAHGEEEHALSELNYMNKKYFIHHIFLRLF